MNPGCSFHTEGELRMFSNHMSSILDDCLLWSFDENPDSRDPLSRGRSAAQASRDDQQHCRESALVRE